MTVLRMATVLLAVGAVWPAVAQAQQTDAQPGYTSLPPTVLDKNFGLPTFGMPGADLPQQRTMAPAARTPEKPDPFKRSPGLNDAEAPDAGVPDFFNRTVTGPLPKRRVSASNDPTMDTPLFTTNQDYTTESTTGEMTTGRIGTDDSTSTLDSTRSRDND